MCRRYYFDTYSDKQEVRNILSALDNSFRGNKERVLHRFLARAEKTGGVVTPAMKAPVFTWEGKNVINPQLMLWGKPGMDKFTVINVKFEGIRTRKTFCEAFEKRRCVIPATAYLAEPDGTGSDSAPYLVSPSSGSLLYFAGIYGKFPGSPEEADTGNKFIILTREAEGAFLRVNPRMPLLIHKRSILPWLSGERELDEFYYEDLPDLAIKRM